MGHRIFRAHLHVPLTAKWTSRVSGTPAGAVVAAATGVAGVAQQLRAPRQLPPAAVQHRQQARRLVERVPRRPRARRLAAPEPEPLRRRLERRQLPAVEAEAEGVVVAISPAPPTRMAPSTPDSARWLATRTACRR